MSAFFLQPSQAMTAQCCEVESASKSESAWKLIERVVDLHSKCSDYLKILAVDGLMDLAERFIACQEAFRKAGKPVLVQVGFHYTSPANLESIRNRGLLVGRKKRHGDVFGSGIYVGNNPHAFRAYGAMGVVVLYLEGTAQQLTSGRSQGQPPRMDIDTLRGNKLAKHIKSGVEFPRSSYFDEIVTRTSDQVLPLLFYQREETNNSELLFQLHQHLQALVDSTLNGSARMYVKRHVPSFEDLHLEHALNLRSNAKKKKKNTTETVTCFGPSYNKASKKKPYSLQHFAASAECPICLSSLHTDRSVSLNKCQHGFHKECIAQALLVANKCPICRVMVGEPFGSSPFGTMTIQRSGAHCGGYPKHGSITIVYAIPMGMQSRCHENPGKRYKETQRIAYLPDNSEGKRLLKRLKYAFERGLLFTVGTSLTTGRKNSVTWTSVHHKTSKSGGPHGFPDPGYFFNCNEELDNLGVPSAVDC